MGLFHNEIIIALYAPLFKRNGISSFLQKTQQFDLRLQVQVSDFIKEEGTVLTLVQSIPCEAYPPRCTPLFCGRKACPKIGGRRGQRY